ncbi:MAG: type II toxin-antitoxin system RatA family toxin [Acidiferrobacterales bacterium]
MNTIRRSTLVPYSAQEMYDLVADIEAYPQFLPWCSAARILSSSDQEAVASIDIAYHKIHKTFTTRNRRHPARSIEMDLVQGPFKHLHGLWRFEVIDHRCSKISLEIEFDFASRALAFALGPIFGNIANNLVDSFKHRATTAYGKRDWQE